MPTAMADVRPGDWDGLVILCGSVSWDGSRLGSNFLADALARRVPVLYVDPPVSLLRRGVSPVPRVVQVGDTLMRATPAAPPAKDRPAVLPLTNAAYRAAIRTAARRLGGDVDAVISGPVKYDPFGVAGERARVFRASDDFAAGAPLTGLGAARLAELEGGLARRATDVVCISEVLVEKWRTQGFDPVLIPNGCDAAFLARVVHGGVLPAPEVHLPRPIAGYLGQLSTRIDLTLLLALADAGVSVLLVGKHRADLPGAELQSLLSRPTVQWVGSRSFDDLLPYLAAMDVGLVPYTQSAFNRASFPLKTLEYLGAGRPVVSTDLPATRWLDTDLVTIATGARQFVTAVQDAARTSGEPGRTAARLAFAAAHSWEARAATYLELLGART